MCFFNQNLTNYSYVIEMKTSSAVI